MSDPGQNEAFETYLKRRSVLPDALSSDDRLEPPAALDAIVLRKAREAIQAQAAPDQGKQQMQRAPRWAVPVALAATIMLCLSIVMNISLNTNRPAPDLQQLTATSAEGDRREIVPGDIPSREVILPEAKVAESPAPDAPVVAEQRLDSLPRARPYAESASTPTGDTRVAARSAAAADKATTVGGAQATAGGLGAAAGGPGHPADPKAWLRHIDALRAAGKSELADAEMRRFSAAFPDYAAKPAPPASPEASR